MRTLEITTNLDCPIRCQCCPQDVLEGVYKGEKVMPLQVFNTVLNNTPTDVRIDFSGFSEPFLNPLVTDMIEMTHNKGHKIAVFTTCFGMTVGEVRRISHIPFETFEVHLQDRRGITRINQDGMLCEVLNTVRERVQNVIVSDLTRIKQVSRAGNVKGMKHPYHDGAIMCQGKEQPARFVTLPNGDVVLCCMDYGLRHVIGDLLTLQYNDLFIMPEYLRVLQDMEDGTDVLCRKCEQAERRIT